MTLATGFALAQGVDETPAAPGEWGFRPRDGSTASVNPPAFAWRPQKRADGYEWQASRDGDFTDGVVGKMTRYPVHCPARVMPTGSWLWRFRSTRRSGTASAWSRTRTVVIQDTLRADEQRQFTWWLHSMEAMDVRDQQVTTQRGKAACRVNFMAPTGLRLRHSNVFDPPPRARVKLVQHHLEATTEKKHEELTFVTVIRPLPAERLESDASRARIEQLDRGYRLHLEGSGDPVVIELSGEQVRARRGNRTFDSTSAVLH